MTLSEILDTIAAAIRAALPALKSCEAHGGRFDAQELMRVAAKAPALFVAITRVNNLRLEYGERKAELMFAGFIVTKDTPGADRAQMALTILQALAGIIPDNRWNIDGAESLPTNIEAQNLFSAALDKKGVAMWAISWRQTFAIAQEVDVAALNDFLTAHIEHDIDTGQDGEPLAQDDIAIPQEA